MITYLCIAVKNITNATKIIKNFKVARKRNNCKVFEMIENTVCTAREAVAGRASESLRVRGRVSGVRFSTSVQNMSNSNPMPME